MRLSVDQGKLAVDFPDGAMDDATRQLIRDRKKSLLEALHTEDIRKRFEERAVVVENDGALPLEEAERLVLPDDNRADHSRDHHRVDAHTLIAEACRSVSGITLEQFRSLCVSEDIADIEAGRIPMQSLRPYAESFAEGISSGRIKLLRKVDDRRHCRSCRNFRGDRDPESGYCTAYGAHVVDHPPRRCIKWSTSRLKSSIG